MLYPSMKTLLKGIGNRYLLVNVVARRAREIEDEAEERGEPLNEKPVTLAIEEIANGELTIVGRRQEKPDQETGQMQENDQLDDLSEEEENTAVPP